MHHVICKIAWAPTEIVSDSEMAVDILNQLLRGNEVRVNEHADLWEQIERAIIVRRENGCLDYFRCRWVPAHTKKDTIGVTISETDFLLNQGADALAVEAAKMHAPP